jgi:alkyl sulfatase BDS1-like metallo-beta-lactamase superfamily hydrolase
MLWFIKEMKAINAAEDAAHTLHNTYSLRGAKIREPLPWSKFLNQALDLWGDEAEVLFGMHHWPVWGNDKVNNHLRSQRDLYRYINDETLRLANQGYTMVEIAERIELPESLATNWSNRGYYGSLNHNVKATYVLYLGWFIGNPATLHPLPPVPSSKKYVEFMGGADAVLKRAKASFDKGEYRWVAQVVNHVVFADPSNQAAKNLQADALEQLGYQAENGPWRNFYLTGAKELRGGVQQLPTPDTASPDTVRAMSLDLFFDFLAMKLNGPKAAGKNILLNVNFPDVNESYLLELSNSVLNHTPERSSEKADASVKMTRETLNQIILKQTTLDKAISAGDVTITGNKNSLNELLSYIEGFDFWFNIVTP